MTRKNGDTTGRDGSGRKALATSAGWCGGRRAAPALRFIR